MVQATRRSRCFCTRIQASRGLGINPVNAYELCTVSNGNPCQPCRKFIELEARILEAENELESLLCEETELRKTINDSHEPFIHHLPLEITAYIFELALPNDWPTRYKRNSMNQRKLSAPLILGAVCHKWRSIAWSLPRLWTYLPIVYDIHMMELAPSQLEVAAEWLTRSCQYPLSISIYPKMDCLDVFSPHRQTRVAHALKPFIPILNAHSYRWKYLDLEIPYPLMERLRGNNLGQPILDRLRVWDDMDLDDGVFEMAGTQPAPTYLVIRDIWSVNINWENVTTIDVRRLNRDEFHEMLRLATQLQDCTVRSIRVELLTDAKTESVDAHNELQSLTITSCLWGCLRELRLSEMAVSFPALKSLTINCDPVPLDSLALFMINCKVSLTSLHLEGAVAKDGKLAEFLRHTPFLETLYMRFENELSREASNLFQLLGRTSSDPHRSFLPNLKDLQFEFLERFPPDTCFRWGHVADIFGPIQDIDKAGRRPLTSVLVNGDFDSACEFNTLVNKADLSRFLKIGQTGVALVLQSGRLDPCDILRLPMQHLGITSC